MLRKSLKLHNSYSFREFIKRFSSLDIQDGTKFTNDSEIFKTTGSLSLDLTNNSVESQQKVESPFDKCQEDVSDVAPYLKPTFNFAAYVNKSVVLQELLKLGVNLHKLEKKVSVPPFILRLDFEKDIKPHVTFLHDFGLPIETIGYLITKNPFIFKEDLDNLSVRINYLYSKKFDKDMILRILSKNPYWLMFSTQRIDKRLGFFQKQFFLLGHQVRALTVKQPKLITYNMNHIKNNFFVIKEEMGFSKTQVRKILLNKPNLFMKDQNFILKTFEYVHRIMGVPLEMIVKVPEILTCREFRIKQRHMFLEKLGKAQYDPKQPNYVSLISLAAGSDADFCENVAKCSVQSFNLFLKTL